MFKQSLNNISVIIPIWNQETELKTLLEDLENTGAEIVISSEGTRAKSLNDGASKATRNTLWFIHADSHISTDNIERLNQSLLKYPEALHFFKLKFAQGGISTLNAYGANIRSTLLGLPYGDQALCISKRQFEGLGGYPEDTKYGEDLLFVRKAKKQNIRLVSVPSFLISSARKYKTQGWLKTTLAHQFILIRLLLKKI